MPKCRSTACIRCQRIHRTQKESMVLAIPSRSSARPGKPTRPGNLPQLGHLVALKTENSRAYL